MIKRFVAQANPRLASSELKHLDLEGKVWQIVKELSCCTYV